MGSISKSFPPGIMVLSSEFIRWLPEGFLWFWFGFTLYEVAGGNRGPLGFILSLAGIY